MSDWQSIKERGNVEFKNKNYEAAIRLYTQAIGLNSNEETLYANRGTCYKALGKFKQAKTDFNKSLEISPRNTKNIKRKANLFIQIGELGDAVEALQKCVNLEPRDLSHSSDLNKVKKLISEKERLDEYYGKQNYQRSEEVANNILKECADFAAVKIIYIESLLANVKLTEAENFLTKRVNAEEKAANEDFNYLLAKTYYYAGKYDKARSVISSLVNKTKDNEKYNKIFKVLKDIEKVKASANEAFKSGKYDEAILQYTKLIEMDPENNNFNSTIYANRALCYQKQNKNMDALKDANKAIALNENYIKAYIRRGSIYIVLNMFEEAKWDLQKAKDAEPDNKDINKLLEDAKREEKKAKKRDYYKILDIKPDAKENDIRKAYKKMALKWHPDRNNESEESKKLAEKTFRDVSDAYSVLSDPKKKQMYDSGMDPLNPEQTGGMDAEDFANAGYGKQGGFNAGNFNSGNFGDFGGPGDFSNMNFSTSGNGAGSQHFSASGINSEDIFKMFFSGGAGDDGQAFFANMGSNGGAASGPGGMPNFGNMGGASFGNFGGKGRQGGSSGFNMGNMGGFPGSFGNFKTGAQSGQKKSTTGKTA